MGIRTRRQNQQAPPIDEMEHILSFPQRSVEMGPLKLLKESLLEIWEYFLGGKA